MWKAAMGVIQDYLKPTNFTPPLRGEPRLIPEKTVEKKKDDKKKNDDDEG